MQAAWSRRQTNPKYAALFALAQQYFSQTGWWPTEVEFNRYTQNLKAVPAIHSSGETDLSLIPKPAEPPKPGEHVKWQLPADPLPPGWDWYFTADGTPKSIQNNQDKGRDIFSGWYQDPRSGKWSYDPLLGAADYLNYSDPVWRQALVDFSRRAGRLPNLQEARDIATRALWAKADAATQRRAQQFAQLNGFWPTPWELENGPSSTPDANAGGGGQNAAGVGTVPVFVPGLGVVLTQGTPMGAGGVILDPFAGIPGSVSPWVKEVLNGTITADQVPPQMRQWVDYAMQKFRDQLPVKHPSEIPWGIPVPNLGDHASRTDSAALSAAAIKPPVEDPNVTSPTTMPDGTLHIPPAAKPEAGTTTPAPTSKFDRQALPVETSPLPDTSLAGQAAAYPGGVVQSNIFQPAPPAPIAPMPAPAPPAPVIPVAPVAEPEPVFPMPPPPDEDLIDEEAV
jgi:hypothetical protein